MVWDGDKMKKLKKDVMNITKIGVGLGVGATVVGKTGVDTSAFTTMSDFMPVVTPIVGGGVVIRQLKGLKKKVK